MSATKRVNIVVAVLCSAAGLLVVGAHGW